MPISLRPELPAKFAIITFPRLVLYLPAAAPLAGVAEPANNNPSPARDAAHCVLCAIHVSPSVLPNVLDECTYQHHLTARVLAPKPATKRL